jgi:hypothetical protein
MNDPLLRAIEGRLAERRRASRGTMTDEQRKNALISLVARARNNDPDAKEGLEKLLNQFKPFPQFSEWVAEQMALSPPMPVTVQPAGDQKELMQTRIDDSNKPLSANDNAAAAPFESIREMTRRQVRAAADDTPIASLPEPPKPEWYENAKPGLSVANRLKTLWGPKPESGDGGWMRKR